MIAASLFIKKTGTFTYCQEASLVPLIDSWELYECNRNGNGPTKYCCSCASYTD